MTEISMTEPTPIEVYGRATDEICSGCEGHACGDCGPGPKKATIQLVREFEVLLAASGLGSSYTVNFYESTPGNIARNADVQKLLSMAKLEPVICIAGKIAFLGGFSPEGLLMELQRRT
jgi:hypothetical protein